MIPEELERAILKSVQDGKIPFFVNATSGTTVFGAFDPLHPIADICEKYKLWLHVDVSPTISLFVRPCSRLETYANST